MKFQSGIQDFRTLITGGYFYADRTAHIPLLEEAAEYMVFLRPPGFGKTLLLSMLEYYYDVKHADLFDSLFGALRVGRQPSAKHSQYFVLKWDFAAVDLSGDAKAMRAALYGYINDQVKAAVARYRDLLAYEVHIDPDDGVNSLHSFLLTTSASKHHIYLLIDNHDAFAQAAMHANLAGDTQRAEALRQTVRACRVLFAHAKSGSGEGSIGKILLTGTLPAIWEDFVDAFNISLDVSEWTDFLDLCGFTQEEVAGALQAVGQGSTSSPAKEALTLEKLQATLGGYAFHQRQTATLFHPALTLQSLQEKAPTSQPSDAEGNTAHKDNDYHQQAQQVLAYLDRDASGKKVREMVMTEENIPQYYQRPTHFGVDSMLSSAHGMGDLIALLDYFGLLTIGGKDQIGMATLQIPNRWARELLQISSVLE